MAAAPSDLLPLKLQSAAEQLQLFKALAHPVRLEILQFLHRGPSCVNLPGDKLSIPQPTLSKHLQILRAAKLIDYRVQGNSHCYFICRPSLLGPLFALLATEHPYRPCSKPEQHE